MYPGLHALRTPDKPAAIVAETGEMISFGELESRSARFARWMSEHGLRRGDHIAVLSDNDLTVFELYWAAIRSGLYVTMVNCHLAPAEAAYIVNDCGAKVLVVSGALAELAEAIVDATSSVEARLAFGGPVHGYSDYERSMAPVSDLPPVDQPRGSDMLYSSGTTGRPKGIKTPLPATQVDQPPGDPRVELLRRNYAGDENTVYLSPAPIYHAAPLRFSAATQALGGTVVLMRKFEAETSLALIEKYRITHSQWVPTHFVRLLKLSEEVRGAYDTSSMKAAIHAAASCPIPVKQAMIDWWGEIIFEYYSSTESAGSTQITPAEWLRKPGSVGQSGPNSTGIVHICGPDGAELGPNDIGTIYFERDDWAFEYHNDPEKTAAARHPRHGNWSTTGDIGYLDEDGYLFLTDRSQFVIISGGVNIYPQEIENCLSLHPGILDVAVIGTPDEEMGETVTAIAQTVPGVAGDQELAADIIAYCRERIAHYKCPRNVEFVPELPRTPTGKLIKSALT
ncbi:acyl-CoA synthetase [Amycolatopsis palatopharyngis]|uniref:acyl-CoA synthetase n=1 Tax=Amycolatopsis palatopharyngis TaxID=187982 RepID=UPI000E21D020|nr:acyl-CoA synthetase [Amycolatopsis palatopharyngis]